MPSSFDEVVFPTNISFGSSGGPEFLTEVIELGGGTEQRNQRWDYPREVWNVGYGIKEAAQLDALLTFFYARRGRAAGFLFWNHRDHTGTDEFLGVGDNAEHAFQLVKHYVSGGVDFTRKISRPKQGTVRVFLDTTELFSPANWSCNHTTGVITFVVPPSPSENVFADFEFYVPVRFDSDYLPSRLEDYQAESAEVTLREIR